jgi:hypothetical protein
VSKLRQPNGDDHPEAAGKHLEDAQSLLKSSRLDGAAYLAGYVVECSLKTIAFAMAAGKSGHGLRGLSVEALRLVALPAGKVAKYRPTMTSGHSLYDPRTGWRPELRYRAPGHGNLVASDWVAEAKTVYESVVVPMKLDGVI